jgi:hypothetical protein
MLRPRHGTSRWLLLFCACIALAATAAIPRGLLRATVLSQLDRGVETSAGAEEEAYDTVEPAAELPGVRVVISREEREVENLITLLAAVPDATPVPSGDPGLEAHHPVEQPSPCAAARGTCAPRAPPASI